MNKYSIEKVLHEIIRDIPECRKTEENYKKGLMTSCECLKTIVQIYDGLLEKAAAEINANWKIEPP